MLVVLFVIIIGIVLQSKAFGQQLAPIINRYGVMGVSYGEGIHPGIDFLTTLGTPIVAVSDGIIVFIGEPYKDKWYGGGFGVTLKHTDTFFSSLSPLRAGSLSLQFPTNFRILESWKRCGRL